MSEVEKRGWPAFDRTVGASAGAAFGVLAALYLGPDAGNILGAAAGPMVEELTNGMRQLAQRKFARVEMAADVASEEAGCELAVLVRQSLQDDRRAALMSAALQAAADAADEQKVRALGRAYARGVITSDDAKVDEQLRIVTTLAGLESIDLHVLDQMASQPSWLIRPLNGIPSNQTIVTAVPRAATVVDAVIARLSTLGLITDESTGGINWNGSGYSWKVTEFGRLCLRSLHEIGSQAPDDTE